MAATEAAKAHLAMLAEKAKEAPKEKPKKAPAKKKAD